MRKCFAMILLAILLQSTSCSTYGNRTDCVTTPTIQPAPVVPYQPTQIDGAAMQNLGTAVRARKARGRAKKVGKLIAAGDCAGAQQYALEKGDLALADYARSYCR